MVVVYKEMFEQAFETQWVFARNKPDKAIVKSP